MIRLAKFVENELDQHQILFAKAEARLMASCDYISHVLLNTDITDLTEEEKKYITKVRESYMELKTLTAQIEKEIQKYKENYLEVFDKEY